MTPQDPAWVRTLAEQLAGTDIDSLTLVGPTLTLRLARTPEGEVRSQLAPAADPATASVQTLRAGSVGVVLTAHPLREEPLVQPGQAVLAGQALMLLQVGQVLLPVTAPRAGRVLRLRAEAGTRVGYGSPLVDIAEPLPDTPLSNSPR